MTKLYLKDIFDGIFEGEGGYIYDGLKRILRYSLSTANPRKAEAILHDMKVAFAGAINKRKLAKISLIWEHNDKESFVGVAPAEIFYPHSSSAKGKIMILELERWDEDRINLIDPATGEIRQNIVKR